MLWLLFCILLVLSPLLMMAALYWTIRQSERLNALRSPVEPIALPAVQVAPTASATEMRAMSAGLEAQFLVAPRTAIRETQAILLLRGVSLGEPRDLGPDESPMTLRLTFEGLIRQVEEAERAHR